eukprot:4018574-Pyramimonas_sp.AAC.1
MMPFSGAICSSSTGLVDLSLLLPVIKRPLALLKRMSKCARCAGGAAGGPCMLLWQHRSGCSEVAKDPRRGELALLNQNWLST